MRNFAMLLKHVASEALANLRIRGRRGSFNERAIGELNTSGLFRVDNFLSREVCQTIIDGFESIERDRPSIFSWESNGADTRLYGADRLYDIFELGQKTADLDQLAEAFYRGRDLLKFQMAGHIRYTANNLGSGSGWHRDSPFSQQFKGLIYLNDVSEENGPFQYIPGSHRRGTIVDYSRGLDCPLSQYRFSDIDIARLEHAGTLRKRLTLTGAAGTLLVANVKGLHRGKPLERGERWAITRYYYKKRIPEAIEARLAKPSEASRSVRSGFGSRTP